MRLIFDRSRLRFRFFLLWNNDWLTRSLDFFVNNFRGRISWGYRNRGLRGFLLFFLCWRSSLRSSRFCLRSSRRCSRRAFLSVSCVGGAAYIPDAANMKNISPQVISFFIAQVFVAILFRYG